MATNQPPRIGRRSRPANKRPGNALAFGPVPLAVSPKQWVIWMMRGYILDIPRPLEEAALVDGLTPWQVL